MIFQKKFCINVLDEIQKSCDRLKKEAEGRKPEDPLSFGISYLDDCLGGIFKSDLVVLGAKTGIGKTEAAKICAMANARNKRVHFFALEAEKYEIERRMKYSMIARVVYGPMKEQFKGQHFNYMDWMLGKFKPILGPIENEIDELLTEANPGLHTYYQGTSSLSENNIEQVIFGIQSQTDLIIIDHLHYFDFEDENENRAMKKLVKTLKRISEQSEKPILLLAHMRKSDRRFPSLIPGIEDFHGSSDISKIATKVVVLSPSDEDSGDPLIFPTFVKAEKNRYDMGRTRFIGLLGYDVKENGYKSAYKIGKVKDGNEFKPIEEASKIPYWAKNAIQPAAQISSLEGPSRKPVQRSLFGYND